MQTGIRLRAPAVDPNLTGSEQLLQVAMAQLGKVPPEPPIEAKLSLVEIDRAQLDAAHPPPPRSRRSFAQPASFRLSAASSPSPVG